jgi:Flp pilus assembly protein TadB
LSRKHFNYTRSHSLRLKMSTQWDHIRARNWLAWFLLSAAVAAGWPSITTVALFVLVGMRLGYVLLRWFDTMRRRAKWRNQFA